MEESRNFEESRFEFALLFNENLVVKRFFDVNYFNPRSVNSVEFTEVLFEINGIREGYLGLIPSFLKKKSLDSCWKFYNPYIKQEKSSINTINVNDKDFNYDFIVYVDKRQVGKVRFNGNIFQSDVTDGTNIIPIIKDITYRLRKVLSSSNSNLTFYGNSKTQEKISEQLSREYINN